MAWIIICKVINNIYHNLTKVWRFFMNSGKNSLLTFVGGIVLMIVGLFIFSQKVVVYSGFFGFGGYMSIGGFHMNSGLIMIPFIIGIVWMFVTDGSIASKIFTVISVILIIVSIIMSTNLHLMTVSLYEWILMLVLIFGGAGLVARVLFASGKNKGYDDAPNNKKSTAEMLEDSVDSELENLKKKK